MGHIYTMQQHILPSTDGKVGNLHCISMQNCVWRHSCASLEQKIVQEVFWSRMQSNKFEGNLEKQICCQGPKFTFLGKASKRRNAGECYGDMPNQHGQQELNRDVEKESLSVNFLTFSRNTGKYGHARISREMQEHSITEYRLVAFQRLE